MSALDNSRKRQRDEVSDNVTSLPTSTNVLASENIFFPLSLYVPDTSHPVEFTSSPPTSASEYDRAIGRVQELDAYLTPSMQNSLTSLLCVVQKHLTPSPDTLHPLVIRVASQDTKNEDIRDIAHDIETGLRAFAARGGREGALGSGSESRSHGGSEFSGGSKRVRSSNRSGKVRSGCLERDKKTCNLSRKRDAGEVAHIISFSVRNAKAVSFWKFVSLFHGEAATEALRATTLSPNPDSQDNLKNVWFLAKEPHDYFDEGKLSMIPKLTAGDFPYDPYTVTTYSCIVEFPFGEVPVPVWKYNDVGIAKFERQLESGDRVTFATTDPTRLPLPHPLLFQLHAIVARIMAMKAAAGFHMVSTCDDDFSSVDFCLTPEELEFDKGQLYLSGTKRRFSADSEDFAYETYEQERPRKVTVVLGEYEQRMGEKQELAREILHDVIKDAKL